MTTAAPDDLLAIPLFLRLDTPERQAAHRARVAALPAPWGWLQPPRERGKIVFNPPPKAEGMGKSVHERDLRALAVQKALKGAGLVTFQRLRPLLPAMGDNEIGSGLRRALELRFAEQRGRKYCIFGFDEREQPMVSDEHASAPAAAQPEPAAEPAAKSAAPAPGGTQEENTMATNKKGRKAANGGGKKAKKAATVKKAATKANGANLDQFGLRKGTTRSEVAAYLAQDGGRTMAQVKEKFGATFYNMVNALKEMGNKVTKDKETGKIHVVARAAK